MPNVISPGMPSGAHDDLRLLARATVHLQGLGVGEMALVDPTDPYISELLEATFLVPVAGESEE